MTSLISEEHMKCEDCTHFEHANLWTVSFGACVCQSAEHYGHVLISEHQACRWYSESKENKDGNGS